MVRHRDALILETTPADIARCRSSIVRGLAVF